MSNAYIEAMLDFEAINNSIIRVDTLPAGTTFMYDWIDCTVWAGIDNKLYGLVN